MAYLHRGFRGGGPSRPVVLLLGWLGSGDRHLQKYSALYQASTLSRLASGAPGPPLAAAQWRWARALPSQHACCLSVPLPLPPVAQDMGASVISHQPSILQTAYPPAADRALLRFMKARAC